MQFPVPQFTDVEDKIIGSLTVKQFGIIFGVGIIIFLGYSMTKNVVVVVVLFLLFGLPALGLALVPFNGRPMYSFIGKLIGFIFSPKIFVFHKEVNSIPSSSLKNSQMANSKDREKKEEVPVQDTHASMLKIKELLSKTASQEKEIADKMK